MANHFNVITENEILLFRELTTDDVDALWAIYSDKEAMRFRGSKPFNKKDDAVEMIDQVIENINARKEFRYGVVLKSTDKLIGTFLIKPVSDTTCMVGCSFGTNYWRKGYGFQAITIASNYLAGSGYSKLIGYIKRENTGSVKLVEKMQFKLVEQTEYPESFLYEKQI